MRVTSVREGIRGIFPLIKQHAPDAVQSLSSLGELPRGYRLAVDATLLVQRLHFADDPHPNRHLIGVHRLVKTLRAFGLQPLMVFDNPASSARLPQKQRERDRRRQTRIRSNIRSMVEKLRKRRLAKLEPIVQQWLALNDVQRDEVAKLLSHWNLIRESSNIGKDFVYRHLHREMEDRNGSLDSILNPEELHYENFFLDSDTMEGSHDFQHISSIDSNILETLSNAARPSMMDRIDVEAGIRSSLSQDDLDDLLKHIEKGRYSPLSSSWEAVREAENSHLIAIASQIDSARREFNTFSTVNTSSDELLPPETPAQVKMTNSERSLYSHLEKGQPGQPPSTKVLEPNTQDITSVEDTCSETTDSTQATELAELAAQNNAVARSYARSSEPLAPHIFSECASVCRLLGVPVLFTGDGSPSGGRPHEAEAMASMLVSAGYADAVASEDSDVLLYDANLLRGLVGGRGLELIDSKKVRRTLFPPEVQEDSVGDKASSRKMLDFALLCGTDFNRTVPGIASRRALRLIQTHGSINRIRQEALKASRPGKSGQMGIGKGLTRFELPSGTTWREFSKELNRARDVFRKPPSVLRELRRLKTKGYDLSLKEVKGDDDKRLERYLWERGVNDVKDSEREVATQAFDLTNRGFGGGPFKDGGPIASWP